MQDNERELYQAVSLHVVGVPANMNLSAVPRYSVAAWTVIEQLLSAPACFPRVHTDSFTGYWALQDTTFGLRR